MCRKIIRLALGTKLENPSKFEVDFNEEIGLSHPPRQANAAAPNPSDPCFRKCLLVRYLAFSLNEFLKQFHYPLVITSSKFNSTAAILMVAAISGSRIINTIGDGFYFLWLFSVKISGLVEQ